MYLGLLLMGLGLLAAWAGVIPIMGLLIQWMAPDLLLAGSALVVWGVLRALRLGRGLATVLTAAAVPLLGLNTRTVSFGSDVLNLPSAQTQGVSRLTGWVGQAIHVDANPPQLSARLYAYDHPKPVCGEGCLVTRGFRTPTAADGWQEDVVQAVLAAGMSPADAGEVAPTLRVRQELTPHHAIVHISLHDAGGQLLARFDGRYRRVFPGELADGLDTDRAQQAMALEYLLHGNSVNWLAARLVARAPGQPLATFLQSATSLHHPQGPARRTGPLPPGSVPPPSTGVVLEVIEQTDHDPPLRFLPDAPEGPSNWSTQVWDSVREGRCRQMLKMATLPAVNAVVWFRFAGDPTGRKKVMILGPTFCDPDALWFLDAGIERGRITLTKYLPNGDLVYRLSFDRPPEPRGAEGFLVIPTFQASDGHLRFEWWSTTSPGADRLLWRKLKVRVKEPTSPPEFMAPTRVSR